jgi:hypothetical protein
MNRFILIVTIFLFGCVTNPQAPNMENKSIDQDIHPTEKNIPIEQESFWKVSIKHVQEAFEKYTAMKICGWYVNLPGTKGWIGDSSYIFARNVVWYDTTIRNPCNENYIGSPYLDKTRLNGKSHSCLGDTLEYTAYDTVYSGFELLKDTVFEVVNNSRLIITRYWCDPQWTHGYEIHSIITKDTVFYLDDLIN